MTAKALLVAFGISLRPSSQELSIRVALNLQMPNLQIRKSLVIVSSSSTF